MVDILRRLREPPFGTETSERNLMNAAADEIERLTALEATAYEVLDLYLTTGGGSPEAHAKFHRARIEYLALRKMHKQREGSLK
jgi:hypothetical protein